MTKKETAVINTYSEQYTALTDDELRNIVRGDAPWAEEARYTYSARCAAHAVLRSRGVRRIPRLPLFDPSSTVLPSVVRWMVVITAAAAVVVMITAWTYWYPPSEATHEQVCEAARAALRQTDISYQHKLSLSGCSLDTDHAVEKHGATYTPIRFTACIDLAEHHIRRIGDASPRRIAIIQRFAPRPATGRYCLTTPGIVAQWVQQAGHPWWIQVALLETD